MSQRVRLEWFERTAQLALAGLSRPEIETELKVLLEDKLSVGGSAIRGNREKVITILQRTWLSVDGDLEPLRLDGLQLIRELPHAGHIAVHWGMVMAAYPFWGAVAETVGRLLRLQGSVGAADVQRRVRELRGERRDSSSRRPPGAPLVQRLGRSGGLAQERDLSGTAKTLDSKERGSSPSSQRPCFVAQGRNRHPQCPWSGLPLYSHLRWSQQHFTCFPTTRVWRSTARRETSPSWVSARPNHAHRRANSLFR